MEVRYHDEVGDFVKSAQWQTQSKILRSIGLLEQYGYAIGMPHVKKVNRLLYELRIRGSQEARILFAVHGQRAILLHGFFKKTQKTPVQEIRIAEQRLSLTNI